MKKTINLLILLGMLSASQCVFADVTTHQYKTHNPRSKKVQEEFTLTIENLDKHTVKIHRILKTKKYIKEANMILNKEYDTLSFTTKLDDEETEYAGEVKNGQLTLNGKLKGEELNRTIDLEGKPLYFTPKFNLTHFVLSDQKEIQFWTLRKDELTPYLMEAKKAGETTTEVDGQEVEAIKIQYSATGKGAKFYRRTYYFRKSDGLFIKKLSPDGTVSELLHPKSDLAI